MTTCAAEGCFWRKWQCWEREYRITPQPIRNPWMHIGTSTQNFPRFRLAPHCPAKSIFLWETEDISPWVKFCCLTYISIADSYISKMVAAHVTVVVGQ